MNGYVALAVIVVALVVGFLVYVALKPAPPEDRGSHAFQEIAPLILKFV